MFSKQHHAEVNRQHEQKYLLIRRVVFSREILIWQTFIFHFDSNRIELELHTFYRSVMDCEERAIIHHAKK